MDLACFAILFKDNGDGGITLRTFLDPPMLKSLEAKAETIESKPTDVAAEKEKSAVDAIAKSSLTKKPFNFPYSQFPFPVPVKLTEKEKEKEKEKETENEKATQKAREAEVLARPHKPYNYPYSQLPFPRRGLVDKLDAIAKNEKSKRKTKEKVQSSVSMNFYSRLAPGGRNFWMPS
jgi:hypothetical protein